jgi:hypothetical protein
MTTAAVNHAIAPMLLSAWPLAPPNPIATPMTAAAPTSNQSPNRNIGADAARGEETIALMVRDIMSIAPKFLGQHVQTKA